MGLIGHNSTKEISTKTIVATDGKFPTPTSTSWSVEATNNPEQYMSCKLDSGSGILGLPGATYKVEMKDSPNRVSAMLLLRDTFGMVLETAINDKVKKVKLIGNSSYEYSMPSLSIQPGSYIEIDGIKTKLARGNMWLDRQAIVESLQKGNELYTGNWLAVVMDDAVYDLTFFWPPQNPKPQWIVGDELNPPIPPTSKFGIRYPRLPHWDKVSPISGVTVLENDKFYLNIANPEHPDKSPHWKSKSSGHTYCTEWKLELGGKLYRMVAVVPGSEVGMKGNQFFEGAACIYVYSSDLNTPVGHAFVEQMGYN